MGFAFVCLRMNSFRGCGMRFSRKFSGIGVLVCLLAAVVSWASINGSISGLVIDPSGSVIVGGAVTATETQTGVKSETVTDSKGFYNFSELPIGTYDIEITANGFKTFRKSGLVVDANSALRVDRSEERRVGKECRSRWSAEH